MIDVDLAVDTFRKKISSMGYEEREIYLKKNGFSFGDKETIIKKINNEAKDIQNIWNSMDNFNNIKHYFIVEILAILGYKEYAFARENQNIEIEKKKTIDNNVKIIDCIYPIVNFNKLLNLFETNEEKIKFLVQCRETLNKYIEKRNNEGFENMTKKLL